MSAAKPVSNSHPGWGSDALALANQAKVLSGEKLDQLVRRLQRMTGHSRESCWRFIIQHGLKGRVEHRRWTEEEIDEAREELARHSVDEVARRLKRTPKALRCALQRNELRVRDIRCDCFSIDALARILHVRKEEITYWIDRGWLQATINRQGKRQSYTITSEAFTNLYKKHLRDLLELRRMSNLSLFEAFYQYCYTPKHTVGEQLLDVRRDKRERAAFAAIDGKGTSSEEDSNDEDEDDFDTEQDMDLAADEE